MRFLRGLDLKMMKFHVRTDPHHRAHGSTRCPRARRRTASPTADDRHLPTGSIISPLQLSLFATPPALLSNLVRQRVRGVRPVNFTTTSTSERTAANRRQPRWTALDRAGPSAKSRKRQHSTPATFTMPGTDLSTRPGRAFERHSVDTATAEGHLIGRKRRRIVGGDAFGHATATSACARTRTERRQRRSAERARLDAEDR